MKRFACELILLFIVCLSSSVGAATVNLDPGYVRIFNYEGAWGGYFGGFPDDPSSGVTAGFSTWMSDWAYSNTPSITPSIRNRNATLPPSSDPTQNYLRFSIGGEAVVDESLARQSTDLRLGGQQYYSLKFDWITQFGFSNSSRYLQLEVPGSGVGPLWSVAPGPGSHLGHVEMAVTEPYVPDICFVLRVVQPVPEPSSAWGLATGAAMMLGSLARMRLQRRRRAPLL